MTTHQTNADLDPSSLSSEQLVTRAAAAISERTERIDVLDADILAAETHLAAMVTRQRQMGADRPLLDERLALARADLSIYAGTDQEAGFRTRVKELEATGTDAEGQALAVAQDCAAAEESLATLRRERQTLASTLPALHERLKEARSTLAAERVEALLAAVEASTAERDRLVAEGVAATTKTEALQAQLWALVGNDQTLRTEPRVQALVRHAPDTEARILRAYAQFLDALTTHAGGIDNETRFRILATIFRINRARWEVLLQSGGSVAPEFAALQRELTDYFGA